MRISAIVDFPAPLSPVNQMQKPWRWRGGETVARMAAVSGRVNQAGSGLPLARNSSRTWVPEMDAVSMPGVTSLIST